MRASASRPSRATSTATETLATAAERYRAQGRERLVDEDGVRLRRAHAPCGLEEVRVHGGADPCARHATIMPRGDRRRTAPARVRSRVAGAGRRAAAAASTAP